MSGAAAVKGTKEFSSNMEAINQKAEQATQKLAANAAAKDIAKNADIPDGMSKSAFKKDVKAQILEKGVTGDSAAEMKENILNSTNIKNADGQVVGNSLANNTKKEFSEKIGENATKKVKKLANKQIKNEAKAKLAEINQKWESAIPQSKSSKLFENAKKLGSALTAAGAQMQQFDNMATGTGSSVGYVGHRLTNPAKTRSVIASINRRKYAGPIG